MATTNLTKASFMIYIQDPGNLLSGIYWNSCSEIGMTSSVIKTANGRRTYNMGGKATLKPITLKRASNVDDDLKINEWVSTYCNDGQSTIDGLTDTGAMLILVPLKPCSIEDPYPQKIKVFNLIPTEWSFWDSDILSETDMAETTITCQGSIYTMG